MSLSSASGAGSGASSAFGRNGNSASAGGGFNFSPNRSGGFAPAVNSGFNNPAFRLKPTPPASNGGFNNPAFRLKPTPPGHPAPVGGWFGPAPVGLFGAPGPSGAGGFGSYMGFGSYLGGRAYQYYDEPHRRSRPPPQHCISLKCQGCGEVLFEDLRNYGQKKIDHTIKEGGIDADGNVVPPITATSYLIYTNEPPLDLGSLAPFNNGRQLNCSNGCRGKMEDDSSYIIDAGSGNVDLSGFKYGILCSPRDVMICPSPAKDLMCSCCGELIYRGLETFSQTTDPGAMISPTYDRPPAEFEIYTNTMPEDIALHDVGADLGCPRGIFFNCSKNCHGKDGRADYLLRKECVVVPPGSGPGSESGLMFNYTIRGGCVRLEPSARSEFGINEHNKKWSESPYTAEDQPGRWDEPKSDGICEKFSPSSWESDGNSPHRRLFYVKEGTKEYRRVAEHFQDGGGGKVVSVQRVENLGKWEEFVLKSRNIGRSMGGNSGVRAVYHGTKRPEGIRSIVAEGFRSTLSGTTTGSVYGSGTYFGAGSHVSLSYSAHTSDRRNRQMFLCLLAVGRMTKGDRSMVIPPLIPGEQTKRFDTLVNKVDSPTIFVAPEGHQAYPAYLITFT